MRNGRAWWPSTRTRFANPYVAAARGYVDEVILPSETRARVADALAMLEDKRQSVPAEEARQHPALSGAASLRKDMPAVRPFQRLLVANRGEIAIRVMRACRELGIETRRRLLRCRPSTRSTSRLADRAERIGPPAARDVVPDRSTRSSTRRAASGAEAIHPGYGFLSENAGVRPRRRGGRARLRRAAAGDARGARQQARRATGRGRRRRADRARA